MILMPKPFYLFFCFYSLLIKLINWFIALIKFLHFIPKRKISMRIKLYHDPWEPVYSITLPKAWSYIQIIISIYLPTEQNLTGVWLVFLDSFYLLHHFYFCWCSRSILRYTFPVLPFLLLKLVDRVYLLKLSHLPR